MYSIIRYVCSFVIDDVAKCIYNKYAYCVYAKLQIWIGYYVNRILIEDYYLLYTGALSLCDRECQNKATREILLDNINLSYCYHQKFCEQCFRAKFGIIYNFKIRSVKN